MSPEELSTLFEAAREDSEVENGQPTNAYLVNIRAILTSILLFAPYDEEHGNQNIVGLLWLMSKYKSTHQGNLDFHSPTRLAVYNPMILDENKPAVVRKKEITWKSRVNNYKLFAKAELKACSLILHAVEKIWFL